MAKKANALLDAVLADPPNNVGPKSWFDRMEEGEAKNQLRELHRAWNSGKLEAYAVQHLHRKSKDLLGVTIGVCGFGNWLRRSNPDG